MARDPQVDEIRDLARKYQYDRYVAALLMPHRHREALIILSAFGAELQRIPDIVSEPMMAAIRFQWWRDELEKAARFETRQSDAGVGPRTGHLLCDALVATANAYTLPFGLLQGMIDAAETELDATQFHDGAETRQTLIKFQGALFELTGRVLGAKVSRDVWNEAAVAYGAAAWAGEFAWRSRTGAQTYVARDVIQSSGLITPATTNAGSLVAMSHQALDDIAARYRALDRAAQGALLPLSTVPPLLRAVAMSQQQFDGNGTQLSAFVRAKSILWCYWLRRI